MLGVDHSVNVHVRPQRCSEQHGLTSEYTLYDNIMTCLEIDGGLVRTHFCQPLVNTWLVGVYMWYSDVSIKGR